MSNSASDAAAQPAEPSAALDVGFSSISNGRNGESSSMAESRSSGQRSNRSWRRSGEREEFLTPESRDKRRDDEGSSVGSIGHRARKSGGFLLDSVFANGSPKGPRDMHGKRKAQDGQLQVDKRRTTYNRRSGESSQRGSPLAREVAWVDGEGPTQTSRAPNVDPAQLVQMALNLSESRKRNVSNTLQVPLLASKRVTSMPMSNYGAVRASSAARNRSSQFSESGSRESPRSTASEDVDIVSSPGPDNIMYTFSPATLARAEKARKYFELASEYRRVLEHLPPLTPDANAPGNFSYESRNQPGSAFPEIRRVMSGADERHELGRQYNPIQALRNRRIRIREKRPFPASMDSWADPENVKQWVDDLERATDSPYYRATPDTAKVPRYVGDDDAETSRAQQGTSNHRRTDTVGSVITRPENSWTIEPTELLADAYWTEKNDNKAYIENRHGNPIFGPVEPRQISTPKISVEMHRGRDDQAGLGIDEQDFGEPERPSRRRRLMHPITNKADDSKRKHRRLISRSSSTSSGSTTDGQRRGREGDEIIGPLDRHMQTLIAQEESGDLVSPDAVSPVDHSDSQPLTQSRQSTNGFFRDSLSRNGRASLDVPRDLHRRARSADGRVNSIDPSVTLTKNQNAPPAPSEAEKRSSTTEMTSTSPAEGRRSLDAQRSQSTTKFPSFSRSGTNDSNRFDDVDFAAATTSSLSPIMSGDQWRPQSSQDTQRPVLSARHKPTDSLSGSLYKLETSSTIGTFNSIREPGSAVGRLFKGGRDRIGTLVRGERFRNRDKLEPGALQDRGASDVSDIEDGEGTNGYVWKGVMDSPNDSSDVSPRASLEKTRTKQKYQLPTFTSSGRDSRIRPGTPISPDTNPFEARRSPLSDTGKSQRLIPPRLNIPSDDGTTPTTAPLATAIRFATPRKSYGELSVDQPPHSSNTLSRSPRQRHWSIYDQVQPLNTKSDQITSRDIARVRALLLCSGIKAREIERRGNAPREPISPELAKAASTTGQRVNDVSVKDEHIHAAHLLSGYLDSSFTNFEESLRTFQSNTSVALHTLLDNLHDRASDQLTKHVHDASDEADAFIVELTTKQPQQTKRVDEAVDTMVRRRRRQFRLLRQVGFKILEWVVLGIMWGIWAVVVGVNLVRRTIQTMVAILRWLFTF